MTPPRRRCGGDRKVSSVSASSAPPASEARAALGAGVFCYLIWGVVPLVFQQVGQQGADAWETMGHRAGWGLVGGGLLVMRWRAWAQVVAVLHRPKVVGG